MKKHILFTFYFLLFTYISTAQLLYLQQNYKGGVSADGKEYYQRDGLKADTISFINTVPAGSVIKKALLLSLRWPYIVGTSGNDNPLQIIFNGNPLVIDSSNIATPAYHCSASGPYANELNWITVNDVTAFTQFSGNQLITPCQNCSLSTKPNWVYVYDGFLLVILYENSSMPAANVVMFLNNETLNPNMSFNLSGLNPIDNTKDAGLSFFTSDLNITWPINFILNSSTGNHNLGNLWFNQGYDTYPTSELLAPGSFYYQNNSLTGLRDDSNNPFIDSTDALCNIKTYITNSTTSFSLTSNTPSVGFGYINAFILAYTTPCPVSSLKDTTYSYTICSGKSQQLAVTTNTLTNTFSWYASDSSVNSLTTPSVVVSPTVSTTYIAYIDSAGCKQTQHFSVGVIHTPTFDSLLTTNAICGGALGSLTITPTYGYGPPAFHFGVNGSSQTSTVFSNLAPGTYSASVLQGGGVCPYIQTFTITQTNPVVAAFTVMPDTLCESKEVYFTNTGSGYNLNVWYINGDSTNTQNTSYVFTDTGFYQITLLAYNNLRQCSDTLTKTILVKYCPPDSINITVPNIFSPNADDVNDVWQLIIYNHNYTISNFQCSIYDRWGLKVFSSTTANEAWSGRTTSGEMCSADAYFYIIKLTATNSKGTAQQKEFKGFITLIK